MRKITKKSIWITAAAAAMLLAGCDKIDSFTQYVKQKMDSAMESATGEVKNGALLSDNTVNLGMAGFDTFQPLITLSQTVRENMDLVYEPLFRLDGTLQPQPVLASDWSLSSDGLRLTVTLRPNILWHDGSTFGSKDAVYSINLAVQRKGWDNPGSIRRAYEADERTIVVELSQPTANPAALLTFPIVKDKTSTTADKRYVPVGTGPYRYERKEGVDRHLFSVYEQYHGQMPSIPHIRMIQAENRQALQAMFSVGELDLLTPGGMEFGSYSPRPNVRTAEYPSDRLTVAGFRCDGEAFSSPGTRRAVSLLFDRQEIVTSLLYKKGTPADFPVIPGSWLQEGAMEAKSLSQAEALMKAEGWERNRGGVFQRGRGSDAQILSVELLTNGDSGEQGVLAEYMARTLRSFGIECRVKSVPVSLYSTLINEKKYDIFIGEFLVGKNMDFSFLTQSGANCFGYANPALDKVWDKIKTQTEEEDRRSLYGDCRSILRADMPFLSLYFRDEGVVYGSKLKAAIQPNAASPFFGAQDWALK